MKITSGVILAAGLAWLFLVIAASVNATVIYFDDGSTLETEKKIYLTDDQLYRAKGGLKNKLIISPVEPTTTGEPEKTDEPQCSDSPLTFGGWTPPCTTEESEESDSLGNLTFG